ncbi:DNA polymerase III subunit chi [Limibaculum sp. M0105]|uniref:DNA polymerase III subunit chi n=1 Tax=Thermohalobaculum xanthum TaxID=2753746 RepID=A0A8J7M5G4_9RHOB|nr:DNA polymerase III subunit chi [Thermohalobaculum xanthum]MBK0398846.1 DNA polymerase III subunit chi [Thermohalobaculum xanthum]
MAEVRFYHLTQQPMEVALPVMLERCLDRGWRAAVRGAIPERIEALDTRLWTWRDDGFLPHGKDGDPMPERQPVWLTTSPDIPNGAVALFLIDGAEASSEEMAAFQTVAVLFDGHDPDAVTRARAQWKAVSGAGLTAVYWAQEDGGRWVKRASSGA